jgi:hypothetical protein
MAAPLQFGLDIKKAPRAVQASLEPIIRFFSYHDAHPVALGMVLMEKFGYDWLDWEAEALRHEIVSTFRATAVSSHNWQKIQAFRTVLSVTTPWSEWDTFENVVLALNNVIPDPLVTQQCTVAQMMAGVDIIAQIREEEYTAPVLGYIASCAIEEGITWLPKPLDIANDSLAEPRYVCKDCGNVGRMEGGVLKDKRCDYCCERVVHGREFDGKPNPGLPKDCGTNIELFNVREPGKVPDRFEEWKGKDSVEPNPKDGVDVQAAKLVVAYKYMLLRRKQLVDQLEELKSWVTH